MKATIIVKTNARNDGVVAREDRTLLVSVNAPPVEGKTYDRVIALLAKHFGTQKRNVVIVRGLCSKRKTVEIT